MIGAMTGLWGHWANLGYGVCDQTVGNVLQRHGLSPAPERKRTTSWPAFIRTHLALLAGTDFFTAEVLTLRGLITYYVLFFIHLQSRRVFMLGSRSTRTSDLEDGKEKSRCRMITGIDLGNSLLNIAGRQNVFHGAVPPGGFEHAERMTSKLIEWSRLL